MQVQAPSILQGRDLLDTAGLLVLGIADGSLLDAIAPFQREVQEETSADEEELFERLIGERLHAGRRFLGALFPLEQDSFVDEVWGRAIELEKASARFAKRELGYEDADESAPAPRTACPGFSSDIYEAVRAYALQSLR